MGKEKKDIEKQETESKDSKDQETKTSEVLGQDVKKKQDKKKKEKPKTEIEKLQEKNKKLEKQISEEKTKYAFLQAELENTRKHYIKQQEIAKKRTKINTITSFTPLIDSFEMALKSKEKIVNMNNDDSNCQQMNIFTDGIEKLYENLQTIFNKFGVKPIEKTNIPSNYKLHEVIMRIINDEVPEDTVLQIVHKGYSMNGEVIRPAKVVVSKKTPVLLPSKPISEIHELSTDEISSENIEKKPEEMKKDEDEKSTPFE